MLRYAITNLADRIPGPGGAAAKERQSHLLQQLRRWSADEVAFVQLREKTLDAGEQWALASAAVEVLRQSPGEGPRPHLLVNARADIAAAAGADGVHLTGRAGELRPQQARAVFRAAGLPHCFVSVSCHTLGEINAAREHGADLLLFGPVFEKRVGGDRIAAGTGLDRLEEACRLAAPVLVLALGGVTAETIPACLEAGAAGVAGIRLFG